MHPTPGESPESYTLPPSLAELTDGFVRDQQLPVQGTEVVDMVATPSLFDQAQFDRVPGYKQSGYWGYEVAAVVSDDQQHELWLMRRANAIGQPGTEPVQGRYATMEPLFGVSTLRAVEEGEGRVVTPYFTLTTNTLGNVGMIAIGNPEGHTREDTKALRVSTYNPEQNHDRRNVVGRMVGKLLGGTLFRFQR